MEEEEELQRQPIEEEEEIIQTKRVSSETPGVGSDVESRIYSQKGGGQHLPESSRSFFEPRFGYDFSNVRVHIGSQSDNLNRSLNARAFTTGHDIFFRQGEYNPESSAGKELLAHELTHVVQQNGTNALLQRQHIADTGWRYTPPASVTRSIVEIQGIVGTTPDGVYGPNTREFVKKYQTKLTAIGLYSDVIDGKWGDNTEAAHVAFATGPNFHRRGYNCAGFAFKTYQFHDMATTKGTLSSMNQLSDCSDACDPFYHKFFYWEFDISVTDTTTGSTTPTWRDFHMVGGQTDRQGDGPDQVMSKDGPRPVVGPRPPLQWRPVTEPVIDSDGNTVPNRRWNVSNVDQECYCHDRLP